VIQVFRVPRLLSFALLALVFVAGCRKQEQEVAHVAKTAVDAEHKAQAAATKLEQQRAALAQIPLPTKSMYVDVHDPSSWDNPFLAVGRDTITLRITYADANPSKLGEGTMLRPAAARRQELQLRPADLAEAMVALPAGAWRYGRVVAVAEDPGASKADRPQMRRNMEAAIQQLNDLGVVVEEWPAR
jgi:hypothetical protein